MSTTSFDEFANAVAQATGNELDDNPTTERVTKMLKTMRLDQITPFIDLAPGPFRDITFDILIEILAKTDNLSILSWCSMSRQTSRLCMERNLVNRIFIRRHGSAALSAYKERHPDHKEMMNRLRSFEATQFTLPLLLNPNDTKIEIYGNVQFNVLNLNNDNEDAHARIYIQFIRLEGQINWRIVLSVGKGYNRDAVNYQLSVLQMIFYGSGYDLFKETGTYNVIQVAAEKANSMFIFHKDDYVEFDHVTQSIGTRRRLTGGGIAPLQLEKQFDVFYKPITEDTRVGIEATFYILSRLFNFFVLDSNADSAGSLKVLVNARICASCKVAPVASKCGACKKLLYCGQACANKHWRKHCCK